MPYLSPYIETLRHQPEATRQRLSLLLALILTLVIFGLWLLTWQTNSAAKKDVSAVQSAGPVSGATSFIGEQVGRVGLGAKVLWSKLGGTVEVK